MKFCYHNLKAEKSNEQGFVILEALVGAAIFGIFMSAVVFMMVASMKSNSLALKITEATSRGADVLEQIAKLPMTDVNLRTDTIPDRVVNDNGENYTIVVTTQLGVPKANAISVQVEVRWVDSSSTRVVGGARVRSVVLRDVKTS